MHSQTIRKRTAHTWNAQHRPLTYLDAAGQLSSYTDALGHTTHIDYDETGRFP
jgi:hypothetical protein